MTVRQRASGPRRAVMGAAALSGTSLRVEHPRRHSTELAAAPTRSPAGPSPCLQDRPLACKPNAVKKIEGIKRVTGNLSNNIYIVENGEELVVVDPGMPSDHARLIDRIKSLGRSPREVSSILLTHFHVDHAGSAEALKRVNGARVFAHEEDVPFLEGHASIPSVYPAGIQGRALMTFPNTVAKYSRVPAVEVDAPFKDGDTLPVLGGLRVYHAPGHTPGSSCFLWLERGILFTGDAIQNLYFFLTLPEAGFSWDVELAGRSAARVAEALRDEDVRVICTGHGPVVRDGANEKMARFAAGLRRRGKA